METAPTNSTNDQDFDSALQSVYKEEVVCVPVRCEAATAQQAKSKYAVAGMSDACSERRSVKYQCGFRIFGIIRRIGRAKCTQIFA